MADGSGIAGSKGSATGFGVVVDPTAEPRRMLKAVLVRLEGRDGRWQVFDAAKPGRQRYLWCLFMLAARANQLLRSLKPEGGHSPGDEGGDAVRLMPLPKDAPNEARLACAELLTHYRSVMSTAATGKTKRFVKIPAKLRGPVHKLFRAPGPERKHVEIARTKGDNFRFWTVDEFRLRGLLERLSDGNSMKEDELPPARMAEGAVDDLVTRVCSSKPWGKPLSRLEEEVLAYLDEVAERAAELPAYYPEHLRSTAEGRTPFDDIRQMVQVVEDRSAFERWMAEERERLRASGQDVDRLAYDPTRARPETEEGRLSDPLGREIERKPPPPPVPWDEHAGKRFRRAVILGDPGFGKTWLLRYEARRIAREAVDTLGKRNSTVGELVLPVFVRLSDVNRSDGPVEDALLELAKKTAREGIERRNKEGRREERIPREPSQRFTRLVMSTLETDRCVVLMDAWDEIPVEVPPPDQTVTRVPHHQQRLGERLDQFARRFSEPRIFMTSRIVGYAGPPILQAKELELLAFDSAQTEAFVRVWFQDDREANEGFRAMLGQNHQLRGLARIPLMLALMCRMWSESREIGVPFPRRRVELYDRCLWGLLRDWKEEKEKRLIEDGEVEAMLELLQEVAFGLFAEGYEQFSGSVLRGKISAWLDRQRPSHELHGRKPASLIAELKHDGILTTGGADRDAPLLFLHRTFHEYLAARALASAVDDPNRQQWDAGLTVEGKQVTVRELVDRKAWDPRWQEVIVLVAGQLQEPSELLELLANPENDDYFRHRLALAGLCLPEVRTEAYTRPHLELPIDRITSVAFLTWWNTLVNGTEWAARHLTRSIPALAHCNGRVIPERVHAGNGIP